MHENLRDWQTRGGVRPQMLRFVNHRGAAVVLPARLLCGPRPFRSLRVSGYADALRRSPFVLPFALASAAEFVMFEADGCPYCVC